MSFRKVGTQPTCLFFPHSARCVVLSKGRYATLGVSFFRILQPKSLTLLLCNPAAPRRPKTSQRDGPSTPAYPTSADLKEWLAHDRWLRTVIEDRAAPEAPPHHSPWCVRRAPLGQSPSIRRARHSAALSPRLKWCLGAPAATPPSQSGSLGAAAAVGSARAAGLERRWVEDDADECFRRTATFRQRAVPVLRVRVPYAWKLKKVSFWIRLGRG